MKYFFKLIIAISGNKLYSFLFWIFFSLNAMAGIEKTLCTESKGLWRIFNHSCFDKCQKVSDKNTPCYDLLEYGCDCGADKCSKNGRCIDLNNVKKKQYKIYHSKKIKTQPQNIEDSNNQNQQEEKTGLSDIFESIGNAFQNKESKLCKNSGGKMKDFRNVCADQCGITKDDMCAQVITRSCDCGPDKCWNNNQCIKNDIRK